MLFVRRSGTVNGGQIKVFDYMQHVAASARFSTAVYLHPNDLALHKDLDILGVRHLDRPYEADAFFLAGLDWYVLDEFGVDTSRRPVINLIQGFTHVDPSDRRFALLERHALRICVSPALTEAVLDTGRAAGPIVTIENAIDLSATPRAERARNSVVIAGAKNAPIATEVASELTALGFVPTLINDFIPRHALLGAFARSEIAVTLPLEREGFFMPPLEAMALGCATVVPDCLGNRSFCIDEDTALVPTYTAPAICNAILSLLSSPRRRQRIAESGRAMADTYSLERERCQFISALEGFITGI